MNKTAELSSLLLCLLLVFITTTSTGVIADLAGNLDSDSRANPSIHSHLNAWAVLEHNKRLLSDTTLGITLAKTSNKRAKSLYDQAHKLYEKAFVEFQAGQEHAAKHLSFQSINTFYQSDRAHYNLGVD